MRPMAKRRMILYFGSFNPVHNGHMAMAEHVMERGLGDEVAMIVSPQNPFKAAWMQAPEMDRLEMVERACRNSRYPDRIHPSVIEFLLDKPSYTVNTLRHLVRNYGAEMSFSILMGSDLINQLPMWRDADEIIAGYDLLVYPRPDVPVRFSTPRTTVLEDAPQYGYSSTRIRDALEIGEDVSSMVDGEVLQYIREHGLWSAAAKIAGLTAALSQNPDDAQLHIERGKCYFRRNEWGAAINDFRRAEQLAPENREARQYIDMAEEILQFRYKDVYNP